MNIGRISTGMGMDATCMAGEAKDLEGQWYFLCPTDTELVLSTYILYAPPELLGQWDVIYKLIIEVELDVGLGNFSTFLSRKAFH